LTHSSGIDSQDPIQLALEAMMFQGDGFRPGDLVWVVLSDTNNDSAAPAVAARHSSDCVMADAEATAAPATPEAVAQDSRVCEPSAAPESLGKEQQEQQASTMDAGLAMKAACAAIEARGSGANATGVCSCIVHMCFLDSGCTPIGSMDSLEQQAEATLDSVSGMLMSCICITSAT
jgi:hypothetical protein